MVYRIAYYVPVLRLGGTETQLYHLAAGLDRQRFQPIVFYSEQDGAVGDQLRSAEVPVYKLHVLSGSSSEYLMKLKADIYHSHNYQQSAADVVLAARSSVRHIITTRGNMRHWDSAQRVCDWERLRDQYTDIVIANCHAVADKCVEVEGVCRRKVRVIYNGVPQAPPPTGTSLRAELFLPFDSLVIGNVGNYRYIKGHKHLLDAFSLLTRSRRDIYLICCGADAGALGSLMEQARDLGLGNSVRFLHSRINVTDVYRALDIYVQSSLSEGLSNALLEAMAHHVPVIATNVGGTPEVVRHGQTGLLTKPGDPVSLFHQMNILASDNATRHLMGAAGAEYVSTQLPLQHMISAHETIYDELLALLR